jgi:glycosyltransferase involved in cell wall biosynthesis
VKHVAIYIGRHLTTAPRPVKEADALASAGYRVTVHGLWFDPRLITRDQQLLRTRAWTFAPYVNARTDAMPGRFRWFLLRGRNRTARELFTRWGYSTADLFGYATARLYAHARRNLADLLIFHSEGGLWAAARLAGCGRPVGVDFEDWFSRDLPRDQHRGRPVDALGKLEAEALRFASYAVTTSHALACALAEAYAAPKPAVIYNSFPLSAPDTAPRQRTGVSIHWFSQTLGPGRGLEQLFKALPLVSGEWRIVLRGDDPIGFAGRLLGTLPSALRPRVEFAATVPNEELPARIAEHDIGVALETSDIPNKNLTVSNKLFQYMNAGLAIVATSTAGHREVLDQAAGAGIMCSMSDPSSIAKALQQFLNDPPRLNAAKCAARRAAETIFAHERQAPLYSALVAHALSAE